MMAKPGIVAIYTAILLISCTKQPPVVEDSRLFQISTIDALLQGDYDGYASLKEISGKGNFGIGTVNALDGELILENGIFYQVKSDGKVYHPSIDLKTPFASVVQFLPEDSLDVNDVSFQQLKSLVDSLMTGKNYFYAIRLEGEFNYVRTRSVPAQNKPYPSLAVVTQNQPEFTIQQTTGKLTGFYCPDFVKGINIPGYHLHYLANDKLSGGHLLDFQLKSGKLKLDKIRYFEMLLPESGSFQKTEYKTDRSAELIKVEGK
jgi:acetolactate decarboxylase